jgi:flavin reductase (DIM6/NTAB) family NADH-FMN oxidoreductase RutF
MHIDPATITTAERYKLLIGAIVPRPIAVVSSVDPSGRPNLAPFSFFAGVGSNPMTLVICPANKPDGTEKDTLRNAAPPNEGGTGRFVVNILHERLARRLAAAAEPLPHGQSEFELAGLSAASWEDGFPVPRVGACSVAYACLTRQIIRTNPGAPAGGNLVLGEVVGVYARDGLADERLRIDQGALGAVGRMGGHEYCRTTERFELPPGAAALERPLPFEAD